MHAPDVFRDTYLRITILITAALMGTIGALTYIFLGNADHLIVLYGIGSETPRFLGSVADVWGIIGIGALLEIINFGIANVFYRRVRTLSYLVGYATLFFAMLLFIGVAVIISTN